MERPLISFYRMLPGLQPRRASTSAAGTLPMRAYQYCEASRLASAFGYYVFLPMSFQIEWDGGTEGLWSFDEGATWYPLVEAAFPSSMTAFDATVPDTCKGYCPPFLTLTHDPTLLQIWTGWFVSTATNYSLLVRPPANLTRATGYDAMEGIVETDRWFGPLFANLRLTRSGVPIHFDRMRPFLQVQPIHRTVYSDAHLNSVTVADKDAVSPELWQAYEESLINPVMHHPERGHYAKTVRRRVAAEARCPVDLDL